MEYMFVMEYGMERRCSAIGKLDLIFGLRSGGLTESGELVKQIITGILTQVCLTETIHQRKVGKQLKLGHVIPYHQFNVELICRCQKLHTFRNKRIYFNNNRCAVLNGRLLYPIFSSLISLYQKNKTYKKCSMKSPTIQIRPLFSSCTFYSQNGSNFQRTNFDIAKKMFMAHNGLASYCLIYRSFPRFENKKCNCKKSCIMEILDGIFCIF